MTCAHASSRASYPAWETSMRTSPSSCRASHEMEASRRQPLAPSQNWRPLSVWRAVLVPRRPVFVPQRPARVQASRPVFVPQRPARVPRRPAFVEASRPVFAEALRPAPVPRRARSSEVEACAASARHSTALPHHWLQPSTRTRHRPKRRCPTMVRRTSVEPFCVLDNS